MIKPINGEPCGYGETLADIVREMRENIIPTDYTDTKYPSEVNEMLLGFADRIEAAAKKEREEIKNLRAALEPVLNIRIDALNRYGVNCESLFGSVILEAQRIYESEVEK